MFTIWKWVEKVEDFSDIKMSINQCSIHKKKKLKAEKKKNSIHINYFTLIKAISGVFIVILKERKIMLINYIK